MACGQRCKDKFPWSLTIRPYHPISGGWQLKTLPPFVKEDRFHWAWKQRQVAQNNSPEQAVEEVGAFLRQNGMTFTAEQKWLTSEHLDDQIRRTDGDRCKPRAAEADEPAPQTIIPMELSTSTMSWSRRYWELFNVMAASDWANPAVEFDRMAQVGLSLTASDAGCKECNGHWRELLSAFPPLAVIKDNPSARCWLYKAHQHTRKGKVPIPLSDIIRGWKWPVIAPATASAIIAEMGMSAL